MEHAGMFKEIRLRDRPEVIRNRTKQDASDAVQNFCPMELDSYDPLFGLQMGQGINETLLAELDRFDEIALAGSFPMVRNEDTEPHNEFKEKVTEFCEATFFATRPVASWDEIGLAKGNGSSVELNRLNVSMRSPIH
jgi:hypothetical protein